MSTEQGNVLEVEDLELVYRVRGIDRPVLRGVSFAIERGGSYGLVGESGCGKSTAALGIVRYLPRNGRVSGGKVTVAGRDVYGLSSQGLREYHAQTVSMVYQNPGAALNPSMRIGTQVAEAFTVLGVPAKEAMERAREALVQVQIADPASVLGRYPHQLSGGMQQRVVIAMALAKEPALLILDEPTTGLDATVEAEVLDLVSSLQSELDTAVLFISHNLGVISKMCDRVGVLYAGRLVEEGPVGRCSRIRAIRTRSASCAASRAAASARTRAGSTRSPASCRASAPRSRAASSPTAARSPTTAAAPRSRR